MHCVILKTDIADENIQKELNTEGNERPQLFIFVTHDEPQLLEMSGNSPIAHLVGENFVEACFMLILCYYTFDIGYPRCCGQFIGFCNMLLFTIAIWRRNWLVIYLHNIMCKFAIK